MLLYRSRADWSLVVVKGARASLRGLAIRVRARMSSRYGSILERHVGFAVSHGELTLNPASVREIAD
jgi:hypothetical protein